MGRLEMSLGQCVDARRNSRREESSTHTRHEKQLEELKAMYKLVSSVSKPKSPARRLLSMGELMRRQRPAEAEVA